MPFCTEYVVTQSRITARHSQPLTGTIYPFSFEGAGTPALRFARLLFFEQKRSPVSPHSAMGDNALSTHRARELEDARIADKAFIDETLGQDAAASMRKTSSARLKTLPIETTFDTIAFSPPASQMALNYTCRSLWLGSWPVRSRRLEAAGPEKSRKKKPWSLLTVKYIGRSRLNV